MFNKKAQVGTTITWVVATLIIVVVLGVSVLATFSVSNEKTIFLDDKKKDIVTTKSITNFLRNSENVDLLKNKKYDILKTKLKSLLAANSPYNLEYLVKLGDVAHSGIGIWGVELRENEEQKIRIRCNEIPSRELAAPLLLTTSVSLENLKLNFGVDEC